MKRRDWIKKADKKSAVSLSFKRLSLTLGDYLSTIRDLKDVDKEVKHSR